MFMVLRRAGLSNLTRRRIGQGAAAEPREAWALQQILAHLPTEQNGVFCSADRSCPTFDWCNRFGEGCPEQRPSDSTYDEITGWRPMLMSSIASRKPRASDRRKLVSQL